MLRIGQIPLEQLRPPPAWRITTVGAGISMLAFPFVVQRPIGCLPLWFSLPFLLVPVTAWAGAPCRL